MTTRPAILALAPTAALTALLEIHAPVRAEEPPPLDAKAFAERVQLQAAPVHPFRYNQGTGPYGPSTKPLLERRRAFHPGERIEVTFRLPEGAKVASPLEVRVTLSLHDLDGRLVQQGGEMSLVASATGVEGSLRGTASDMPEGQYLLAARFRGEDGALLATRSEIVFFAPSYPRLLAEAEAALARARERAASLDPTAREISLASTEMLVEDARMRWSDFGRAPRDWDFIRGRLETARAYAERLAAGEDPWKDRTGAFVKAYRSEVDDTLQPYALYVPPSYDPRQPWPLMVSLHGATSNHLLNRRRVFGLGNRPGESDYEAIRNEDVDYPDVGFIVLSPYGRGEVAGYGGIAEGDVLRAMDHVAKAYNVDPDRVHLTGLSMGGGGTWHLGLAYPDRFASISPVCAVADMDLFPWTAGWSALDHELMTLTGYSRLAANASNLQVFAFHGDEDDAVGIAHSRRMMEAFTAAGLADRFRLFELPGVHHFAWDFAYRNASLFRRTEAVRRDAFPARVSFSTFSPRYNRAYWLRVDRLDRGFRLARIEGTRGAGSFDVKTDNLSAFSILLGPQIAPAGRALEVRVDGQRAFRGTPRGEVLSFARTKRAWKATAPWTGPPAGPPDHAEASFRYVSLAQYGPHVYVYGTAGDQATTAAAKAGAEMLADWGPNVRARWRVLADTEVTPELMASQNLVLVGTAATNRVIARMQDRLPLRQDATGTFAGSRRIAGPGAAYRLQHPNPLAPARMVLIYGGASPVALKRFLPSGRQAPAYSLFADYLVIGEDDKVALEGYFRDDYGIAAP